MYWLYRILHFKMHPVPSTTISCCTIFAVIVSYLPDLVIFWISTEGNCQPSLFQCIFSISKRSDFQHITLSFESTAATVHGVIRPVTVAVFVTHYITSTHLRLTESCWVWLFLHFLNYFPTFTSTRPDCLIVLAYCTWSDCCLSHV